MDGLRRPGVRTAIVLLGVYAAFWIQFWVVRPTNFGGIDEWMILSLVSRGAFDIPYANRPLGLAFNLPAALFQEHLLGASLWLHGHYLVGAGLCTSLLLLRLQPERPRLAFLAGVFAACWAPSDPLRLDSIYSAAYAGVTAATALVFLLLARPSVVRVSLAAGLAFVITRIHEGPLPVLLLAPLLLRGLGVTLTRAATLGYSAATGLAALVAGLPLLLGRAQSWYQGEVLGVYLDPAGLVGRMAGQFRLHLEPIATTAPAALFEPAPLLTAAVVVLALWLLRGASAPIPARLALFAGVGALGAAAAYSSFILARRLEGALRTEFLAAPWIGLAIAALISLFAGAAPRRVRFALLAGLGALVAAAGAARTRGLQATWDAVGSYPRQAGALAQIARLAPGLAPGTLVLFLDDAPTWIGSFPFHHGLDIVYGRHVAGCVPAGREPLFYTCRATPEGYEFVPWRVLEGAWGERRGRFGFDALVVFRSSSGRVELVEKWPADLPPLPLGARYAPRERLAAPAPPASRLGLPGF